MKFLRKVKSIEVKRCFVISDYVRRDLKHFNRDKKVILQLPERFLDLIIKGGFEKRIKAFNKMQWYLGTVSVNEVGVWKRAGGLPLKWTKGSLEETASFVAEALKTNSKILTERSRTAIPGILKNSLSVIQKEKYLFPIVLPGGTMGRRNLKKMQGDINDGCMRSIALAVSGKKTLKVYIGKRIKSK